MLKLMDKKIFTILCSTLCLSGPIQTFNIFLFRGSEQDIKTSPGRFYLFLSSTTYVLIGESNHFGYMANSLQFEQLIIRSKNSGSLDCRWRLRINGRPPVTPENCTCTFQECSTLNSEIFASFLFSRNLQVCKVSQK